MKHRAIIVGAGRVGASYNFMDDGYSHAGAYVALKERVELVGFVEPDIVRNGAAIKKWGDHISGGLPSWKDLEPALETLKPAIVSVCVQPWEQQSILKVLFASAIRGIWCEKPYWGPPNPPIPVQTNFMRRADELHREIALTPNNQTLTVTGKLDYHTVCHFEDLARWWKVKQLIYNVVDGPCSYSVQGNLYHREFPNGGVDAAACFRGMLRNLLDHLDNGTPLFSPAR